LRRWTTKGFSTSQSAQTFLSVFIRVNPFYTKKKIKSPDFRLGDSLVAQTTIIDKRCRHFK